MDTKYIRPMGVPLKMKDIQFYKEMFGLEAGKELKVERKRALQDHLERYKSSMRLISRDPLNPTDEMRVLDRHYEIVEEQICDGKTIFEILRQ